ncbi:MAG: VWA domain-containing protein, partial [Acidobacteriota bacterium]
MKSIVPAVLVALLLSSLPAPAQTQPTPSKEEGYFEAVNVTVVNVDVYVTDKSGNRVRGLSPADFELFEDGRPVQISNFYVVENGKPVAEPTEPPAPQATPSPAAVAAAPPMRPEEQQLSLVIYIDNFNLKPFDRNRVFRELRQFLTQNVKQGDRVMLVTYDRERHVRVPFTTDLSAVAAATFDLEKISAQGVHQESDRRGLLDDIDRANSLNEVYSQVRTYAESQYNDLSFTTSALRDFVTSLAGLPGRKALLYVSDGLQIRAGEDLYYALQDKFKEQVSLLEAQTYDLSRTFQELAAEANANRVTFYTIDAAGLRVSSAASAETNSPRSPYVDQVYTSNLQAPLQMMAEQTGGLAVLNANNVLPALQKIAIDFDTYYSLGYTPSHAGD